MAARWIMRDVVVARLLAMLALGGLVLPSAAAAANYSFINIADSGQFLSFDRVSMNNSGTVAFAASPVAGGRGVFTGAGGPITTIVDTGGALSNFGLVSINDSGMVAFIASFDANEQGVFVSTGGPVTAIVDTARQFNVPAINAGSTIRFRPVNFPAINRGGAVAFRAVFSQATGALLTGNGGPLTLIADERGPLGSISAVQPSINDSGTVAFVSTLDSGGAGVFTGNGGPLTTIASFDGGFTSLSGNISINANGTVAFEGRLGTSVDGIFVGSGGPITTIADSSGPFISFDKDPVINASGSVAFRAGLDAGGFGIFTGPDPLADKIIRTGDPLFGSTVAIVGRPGFPGYFDMNDNGDVAFRYELANGAFGIAVARLVPEPSLAILLAVGLAGWWRSRCRRHTFGMK